MTVVVSFLCSNGAVVAADSMLTSSFGNIPLARHTGKKLAILSGRQVFAYAGDQGQGDRLRFMAESMHGQIAERPHPIGYGILISSLLIKQFQATGIAGAIDVNAVLAYAHKDTPICCMFEGSIQPRLLDEDHFYCAFGSGKLGADPFLRFLVDVFCQDGWPKVREAVFLATWAIEHVIRTNPGGVAGPIRVGVLERDKDCKWSAYEVDNREIAEHQMAIESATGSLRSWRAGIVTGEAASAEPAPEFEEEQPEAGATADRREPPGGQGEGHP